MTLFSTSKAPFCTRWLIPILVLAFSATVPAVSNPSIPANPTLTVADKVSQNGAKADFSLTVLKELVSKGKLREFETEAVIIYGEHSGDQGVWKFKGVRLLDLVKLASGYEEKMDNALYKKRKGLYLAAYASDGYSGVLSWAELLFTPTGAQTLVAYEWKMVKAPNSGATPVFAGDLLMVVPTDNFSGAREIQALKLIELRHIGEPMAKQ